MVPRERAGPELQSVDDDERATRDADPAYLSPDYVGTRLRSPRRPLLLLPQTLSELTGPAFGHDAIGERDSDLTAQHDGEPLGERIIVSGRVLDGDGRPVRNALIEIWQANAAGRYRHHVDQHPAPLDPNFTGAGRCMTDDEGATASSRSSPAPTRGRTTTTPGARRTSTSRSSAARSPSGS